MSSIETIGRNILIARKPVIVVCTVALVATILLITIRYFYTPLSVDGGWYSYPALALSKDRDPGENLCSISELKNIEGVKASFHLDFRQSIRVIPMSLWFRIIGTNIWAVKLYGIFELSILMGMAYLLLRRISENENIALLCTAIYLTDGVAISLGSSDLRADIMLTFMTLLVFLLTCIEVKNYRSLLFVFGVSSISFLALIRLTSVFSLSFLISYMIIELFLSRKRLSNFKKWFYISMILSGIVSFFMRTKLWDIILPSQYTNLTLSGEGNLWSGNLVEAKYYASTLTVDILPKMIKEIHRWTDYFFMSNLGEFLAILLAFPFFIICLLGLSKTKIPSKLISIPMGCVAAIGVLAFVDPIRCKWAAHALPVVIFFIIILAMVLNIVPNKKQKYLGITLLFVFVIFSSGIKIAQGINIMRKGILNGYTNNSVIKVMKHVFNDEEKSYNIIGPTELWPYINQKTNIIIIDKRSTREIEELKNHLGEIDYIIINNDYQGFNWEEEFRKRYINVELETIAKVGKTNSGWYFVKILKPHLSAVP